MKLPAKVLKYSRIINLTFLFLIPILLILVGYHVECSGFNSYKSEVDVIHYKTLWDWMELLIIPAILGFAAIYLNFQLKENELNFTREEHRRDENNNRDQFREKLFQDYLNNISDLLVKDVNETESVFRNLMIARTITTLKSLDTKRINAVFQFLRSCNLNYAEKNFISFEHADLAYGEFMECDMHSANLFRANFAMANLYKAILASANLGSADLFNANLMQAYLMGANLRNANLMDANLIRADLSRADLTDAHLERASFVDNEALTDNSGFVVIDLISADLQEAILIRSKLIETDCKYANFKRARLDDADFSGAKLEGTDFTDAIISDKTVFKNIIVNEDTKGLPPEVMKNAKWDKVL